MIKYLFPEENIDPIVRQTIRGRRIPMNPPKMKVAITISVDYMEKILDCLSYKKDVTYIPPEEQVRRREQIEDVYHSGARMVSDAKKMQDTYNEA